MMGLGRRRAAVAASRRAAPPRRAMPWAGCVAPLGLGCRN